MKSTKTIETVIKDGLCTGCGTCLAVCPKGSITMPKNKQRSYYLPQVDNNSCNQCGICYTICPGHEVDFKQLNSEIFGRQPHDILLGNYLNCYTGFANEHAIRYNSASGGIITAILIFALEQGMIDGALVTRMRKDNPLDPEPFIARTRDEISSAAKSKYCPVPANIALSEILKAEGRFAVVGLPCHIHGIRKAEQVNKKLKEKITFHLGIVCAYTDSFIGTEFVLRKYGMKKEDISQLCYRGAGWPGNMTIVYKNTNTKVIPFEEYIQLLHGGFFTPTRCILCCDQAAELADISCGDAWLPEITKQDKTGISIVISRTDVGQRLLEQAVAKNAVTLTEIAGAKLRGGAQKRANYKARSRIASLLGKKIPSYKTEIPGATLLTYYAAMRFFTRKCLSPRYMQWTIVPYCKLRILAAKLLKS